MGKALVLKNVDFSVNKLDTITIEDSKPCTGITLSQSVINFTNLTPVPLSATVAPLDTTDTLVWQSSDNNVATVSNGLVRCTGFGNATITAICGAQRATCSVTVANTITLTPTDLDCDLGYIPSTSSSGGNWISKRSNTNKYASVSSPDETVSGYRVYTNSDNNGDYPIMIPNNATTITVGAPSGISGITMYYVDSAQHPTGENVGSKLVYKPSTSWSTSHAFTIPDKDEVGDFDSFICTITFKSEVETFPEEFSIIFS